MLHIIGIDHGVQTRKADEEETEAQQAFSRLLTQSIQDIHPTFIAEEESEQHLLDANKISIAERVAHSAGIKHRFCDPNQEERRSMGYIGTNDLLTWHKPRLGYNQSLQLANLKAMAIEVGQYFLRREQCWLRGLDGCREQDAVFICGDGHIESKSFTTLLESEDIPYRILHRGIGLCKDEHERVQGAIEYLRAHPELKDWERDFLKKK
jgi:hypothetical protein